MTDHVFILDDSLSMGLKRGAGTVFSAAADDLARLAAAVPKEDRLAIYLTSDRGTTAWMSLGTSMTPPTWTVASASFPSPTPPPAWPRRSPPRPRRWKARTTVRRCTS